eukprot:TRINITY_DN27679_c0_g1_i1.p1 TRINITY_DN27679_c0_g1~~TRINITY_DN27679_c0_g1_i1.p1  ORF type:complete len:496 (-),score=72.00 TRINITY_DN27679_c0_g1_i1:492-1979(-)
MATRLRSHWLLQRSVKTVIKPRALWPALASLGRSLNAAFSSLGSKRAGLLGLDCRSLTSTAQPGPNREKSASAGKARSDDSRPVARLKEDLPRQLTIDMGHPWIFDDEIRNIAELNGLAAGTVVDIVNPSGDPIGVGVLNRQASILIRRVEGLQVGSEMNEDLLRGRLHAAFAKRESRSSSTPAGFCRAVNGEQDGLPGVVVDRFGSSAVVTFESVGSTKLEFLVQEELTRWIGKLQQLTVHRMTSKKEKWAQEGSEFTTSITRGDNPRVRVEEKVCRFDIDVLQGVSCNWNYGLEAIGQELAPLIGSSGTVLDAWANAGQWGIRCAKAGALEVVHLEDSLALAKLCRDNAALNGVEDSCTVLHRGDVTEELRNMANGGIRFNCVSLNIRPRFERYFKERRGQFGRWFKPSLKGYETAVYLGAMVTGRGGYLVVSFLLPITREYWAQDLVQGGLVRASRSGSIIKYTTSIHKHAGLASSVMEDSWNHVVICIRLH